MATKIWAGLDVGVETTKVCVIDDHGAVLHQATCPTTLNAVHQQIKWLKRRRFARLGLEAAGGMSLARGLRSLGYVVDLYETRQLSKFLRVRRNKTDAGDAIGIAEAGRIGASLVSKVYLKSLECQSIQSELTIRRHLIRQRIATTNLLCRQLELYGGRVKGSTRTLSIRSAVEREMKEVFGKSSSPPALELYGLLDRCEVLFAEQHALDSQLKRLAFDNDVCRRFMEIPGVGPICALTFYAAVGDPHRFARSADVGSYLGLTPRMHQSGLTVRTGRISRMGHRAARTLLVMASLSFMKWSNPASSLRNWANKIEQRSGRGQARIALARKLAVLMVSMWKSGQGYDPRLAVA